jgi:hypothetical protein
MKIAVLYGPGETKKRTEMLEIKSHFSQDAVSVFDLSSKKIADIYLALSSISLFDSLERLFIIESTPDDFDLKKIVKVNNSTTLIFLAALLKPTSKLLLSANEIKAKIINFEAEKETSVFPFLDNLIEGKKEVFSQLQQLIEEYGGIYILTMIYYLLRRNLLPLPKSGYIKNKIKMQKQNFTLDNWQEIYLKTLKTDFAIKNGTLPERIALTKLTQEFVGYLR